MSQQLRQIKTRIKSIEGTWKITRAMEMVSMSKFRSLQNPLTMGRAYYEKLRSIFSNVLSALSEVDHPLIRSAEKEGPLGVCIISSDTGLCASHNDDMYDVALDFIKTHEGREVKIFVYGRKGMHFFKKKGYDVVSFFPGLHGRLKGNFHEPFLMSVMDSFLKGDVTEIHMVSTIFQNALVHHPVIQRLFPVLMPATVKKDFVFEEGDEGILAGILPLYVSSFFRLLMLETLTAEHSARMVAMRASKDNAKGLMGDLILLRNKMRQAMITREVIEIISSAEALKG